jgi:hypothetical protein
VATLNLDWTITPTGTVVYEVYASPAGVSDVNVETIDGSSTAAADLAANIGNLNATITSRSSHTAANVRTEMDTNSTSFSTLLTRTGSTGVALSATATQAVVDDLLAESLNGSLTAGSVKAAMIVAFAQFVQSADGLTLTYQKPDGTTGVSRTNVRADINAVRSST